MLQPKQNIYYIGRRNSIRGWVNSFFLFLYLNGRHLIDRISDWPNPRGFTKGVRFVCLNRYIQVDQKPFGQSEIRSIRVLWIGNAPIFGGKMESQNKIVVPGVPVLK